MLAILDAVIAPAPAKGVDFTTAHRSRRMDMSQRFLERFGPGSITSEQGGNFECLPLAPALVSGPGSGELTVSAMYVTRRVRWGSPRARPSAPERNGNGHQIWAGRVVHRPGHGWLDESDSRTGRIDAELPGVHALEGSRSASRTPWSW